MNAGRETQDRILLPGPGLVPADRANPALHPAFAAIETSDALSLVARAAEIADHITYYDERNNRRGSWRDFLIRDPVIGLALIVQQARETVPEAKDVLFDAYRSICDEDFDQGICFDTQNKRAALDRELATLFGELLALAFATGHWQTLAQDDSRYQDLLCRRLVNDLEPCLFELMALLKASFDPLPGDLQHQVSESETYKHILTTPPDTRLLTFRSPDYRKSSLKAPLRRISHSLQSLRTDLGRTAAEALQRRLDSGGDVAPHTALLVTFAELLSGLHEEINDLPGRHLDDYYYRRLGLRRRRPRPEKIDIAILPTEKVATQVLPSGFAFDVGKNRNGDAVHYALEEPLYLSSCRVARILTRSRFSDGRGMLRLYGADVTDADGSWPLLGSPRDADTTTLETVILSPALLLDKGRRCITLTFTLDLQDDMSGPGEIDTLARTLLRVSVSTPDGWWPVPQDSYRQWIAPPDEGTRIVNLQIDLPPDAPPITGNDDAIEPGIRLVLDPECPLDAVTLFCHATIRQIDVSVQVTGVRDLDLNNDQGPVPGDIPFAPFGNPPVDGGKLSIATSFLSLPLKIDRITLRWSWRNMPGDLDSYFRRYRHASERISNRYRSYRLQLAWTDTQRARTRMLTEADLTGSADQSISVSLQEDLAAKNGVLELAVTTPSFGFGHALYPKLVAEAMQRDSRSRLWYRIRQTVKAAWRVVAIPLFTEIGPRRHTIISWFGGNLRIKPLVLIRRWLRWTPVPESMKIPVPADIRMADMSFEATGSLRRRFDTLEDDGATAGMRLVHKFADGQEEAAFRPGDGPSIFKLPDIGHVLLIGLSDVDPGTPLTLLFDIPASLGDMVFDPGANPQPGPDQGIQWSILHNRHWHPLAREFILDDSTGGLLNAGILTLSLPDTGIVGNTPYGDRHYWLKAEFRGNDGRVSWCRGITAHGARLSHVTQSGQPDGVVRAGSVTGPVTALPAIAGIVQPYDSFGGRTGETEMTFRTRVSERLRHRDRAILPWDIEHLVAASFPNLGRVKCLPATGPDGQSHPGAVTIVTFDAVGVFDGETTFTLPSRLRNRIHDFVSERAPTGSEIHIITPPTEPVLIRATVTPTRIAADQYWRRELDRAATDWLNNRATIDNTRYLGEPLNRQKLTQYLAGLPVVQDITDLQIVPAASDIPSEQSPPVPTPQHPAGIFISADHHDFIENAAPGPDDESSPGTGGTGATP